MTFGGRQPSVEDDLQWKKTFGGRQPLMEDNLWWKMTFGERRPLVEDDLPWKTILACCLVRFAVFLPICLLDGNNSGQLLKVDQKNMMRYAWNV